MQRDEHESSFAQLELLGNPKRAKPPLEAAEGVDHRVPDEVDALGLDSLPTKVLHRILRVGEQMVGELVRDDPVHLLRHRAIEAPQSGLDVPVGDTELDEHERCSQRRVDVTCDERDVRGSAATTSSSRFMIRAVCSACEPDPISSRYLGSGRPSWSMKISESSGA